MQIVVLKGYSKRDSEDKNTNIYNHSAVTVGRKKGKRNNLGAITDLQEKKMRKCLSSHVKWDTSTEVWKMTVQIFP